MRRVSKIALSTLLLVLALGSSAQAAVTFDSKFEKGSNGSTSPFAFVSNAGTVTGTVGSNSNRVLIGYIAFRGITSSAVAMTWNSVSMTLIGSSSNTAGGQYDVYFFGLIAPATGNQTLSGSWTGGSSVVAMGAVSVYDADQSTGWQNFGSDSGTGSPASSVVTSANGNMAIAAHVNDNGASTAIANGTSAWSEGALDGNYAMGYQVSSGSSTTVGWTFTGAVGWGNLKVDVIAFSGGGGGTPKRLLLLGCCEAHH
jgi:hypothetical protein